MNAPTMMTNRINNTKIIAALKPVPHPQLFINHSSFICLFTYILWLKNKMVRDKNPIIITFYHSIFHENKDLSLYFSCNFHI